MATDIVANVVYPVGTPVPVVPTGMVINPYLDWTPLFGIPLWLIIGIGFIGMFIVVNLYWVFRMKKMAPVKGYVQTANNQTQEEVQVWVISKIQKLTIECLKIKDSVISFYDKKIITRWHHNTPMSVIRVGGVPAVIVSEDFDQTRDIISEVALCFACEQFNFNQEKLKEEIKKREDDLRKAGSVVERPTLVKPITDYTDYENYGHRCLQVIHPDGIEIPAYNIFDTTKFRKYFPLGCTAGFFGGEFLRDSRKLNMTRKEKSLWEKIIPLGIIFGIVLVAVMAAWMFPLKG
jgi:hypothetical protein